MGEAKQIMIEQIISLSNTNELFLNINCQIKHIANTIKGAIKLLNIDNMYANLLLNALLISNLHKVMPTNNMPNGDAKEAIVEIIL